MPRVVLDSYNLREAERQMVVAALQYSEALADAAERLGISYNALRYRMRKFDLARDGSRKAGVQ